MRANPAARRISRYLSVLLIAVLGGAMGATAAAADPGAEGSSASLNAQLDAATRGYVEANAKAEASKTRQQQLTTQLADLQSQFATESAAVKTIAVQAYQTGGLNSMALVLGGGSPGGFVDRLALINALVSHKDEQVRQLAETRDRATAAKAAIDAEVKQEQEQLAVMAQRKQQAERALAAVGGGQATAGFVGSSSIVAEPAPRNADGSWPVESCSVYEPVTGGCITPRMAHARDQAKAAGFTRYVSCYRSVQDGGEHPKGRACDFAAAVDGFGGQAVGEERTYGNNLAAFLIFNASRLGVLYVIWYRQIWLPGSGWRAYSGSGSPSNEHTNHVHLSVY